MKNLKIFTKNIEEKALEEINLLLEQEAFKDCKVRIMPDVHAGMGCVIGFTADLGDKVIPNVVGVDIGCGMLTVELGKVDLDLEKLDNIIKQYVPNGFDVHSEHQYGFYQMSDLKCYKELRNVDRIMKSIGTLGGGNHFIEVDEDDEENKYLVIHTGSRNLGKQVADIYQQKAINTIKEKGKISKEHKLAIIKKLNETGKKHLIEQELKEANKICELDIPKDLCYLEGNSRNDYLHDMKICQQFANINRFKIAEQILFNYFGTGYTQMSFMSGIWKSFETVHNYIDFKSNITRKGAISAKKGEIVLIPINMRDGCIIAKGKGNENWNQSAPHGAGRIMSRTKAKQNVDLEEFEESMKNVFTTSVNNNTIDEAPMVYKPMQEIIDNISDTVEIIKIIKPIYNFKASE